MIAVAILLGVVVGCLAAWLTWTYLQTQREREEREQQTPPDDVA